MLLGNSKKIFLYLARLHAFMYQPSVGTLRNNKILLHEHNFPGVMPI